MCVWYQFKVFIKKKCTDIVKKKKVISSVKPFKIHINLIISYCLVFFTHPSLRRFFSLNILNPFPSVMSCISIIYILLCLGEGKSRLLWSARK